MTVGGARLWSRLDAARIYEVRGSQCFTCSHIVMGGVPHANYPVDRGLYALLTKVSPLHASRYIYDGLEFGLSPRLVHDNCLTEPKGTCFLT